MSGNVTNPDKNLHASVPPALLARAAEVTQQEHITLNELVSEAMERRVNKREFDEVLAFGKRHAKARGLKPVLNRVTRFRGQRAEHLSLTGPSRFLR